MRCVCDVLRPTSTLRSHLYEIGLSLQNQPHIYRKWVIENLKKGLHLQRKEKKICCHFHESFSENLESANQNYLISCPVYLKNVILDF